VTTTVVALHANAIAEDRAAGERRRRIDADDADLLSLRAVVRDHRIDDRRLPGARVARDADQVRLTGVREQRLQRVDRIGAAVIEIAHEARGGADVSGEDEIDNRSDVHGDAPLNRCSGPAGE
jgi:hypothetical protein